MVVSFGGTWKNLGLGAFLKCPSRDVKHKYFYNVLKTIFCTAQSMSQNYILSWVPWLTSVHQSLTASKNFVSHSCVTHTWSIKNKLFQSCVYSLPGTIRKVSPQSCKVISCFSSPTFFKHWQLIQHISTSIFLFLLSLEPPAAAIFPATKQTLLFQSLPNCAHLQRGPESTAEVILQLYIASESSEKCHLCQLLRPRWVVIQSSRSQIVWIHSKSTIKSEPLIAECLALPLAGLKTRSKNLCRSRLLGCTSRMIQLHWYHSCSTLIVSLLSPALAG